MNKAIDPVGVRSTYNDNLINSNRNNAIHISCLYSGIEAEEQITKIQFSRVSGACMQIFVSFFTFSGQKRGHLYLKSPSIPPTALSETLGIIVSHPLFHLRNEMKQRNPFGEPRPLGFTQQSPSQIHITRSSQYPPWYIIK